MAMFPIEPNPAAGNDPYARLQMLLHARQQMMQQAAMANEASAAPAQMPDALARLHAMLTPPDVAAQTPLPPQGIHSFGPPGTDAGVAYPSLGERQTIAPRVPGDPNGPLVYHHTPPHMPQFPQYNGIPGQVEGDTMGRQQPTSSLVQAAVGRGVVNGMKTPPRVPVGFGANRYVAQFGH